MSLLVSQLIRLIAIIAVIIIHGSYQYQMNFKQVDTASFADWVGVLFNQMARFSVPVFVFLSGYGLSIKFYLKRNQHFLSFIKDFYFNRMSRIGVPFIIWSLIFLIASHKIGYSSGIGFTGSMIHNIQTLGYTIYFTGADYHFYFFTIILWCYLFFPFLVYIIHSGSRAIVVSLFIALLLLQWIYLSPAHLLFFKLGIERPVFPSSFFAKWLFYFYLGILLAKKDVFTRKPALDGGRFLWPALLSLVSFGFVFGEYLYNNNGQDPGNFDHFHRFTVWMYVVSLLWLIRQFNVQLTNSKLLQKSIIGYFAGISFTVYIIHTSILRLLPIDPLGIFLRIILAILASFTVASLLDKLIGSKIPAHVRNFLRLALGLPKS